MDLAVVIGAFGLRIAVYAAMELEPEEIGRRVLFGVGGLAFSQQQCSPSGLSGCPLSGRTAMATFLAARPYRESGEPRARI